MPQASNRRTSRARNARPAEPIVRRSRKEDAIRSSATKAAKRKEWGGVARRGAAWMGREGGDSTYAEPERGAPDRVKEEWVLEDTSSAKRSLNRKTTRKPNLSEEAIKEINKLGGKQAPRLLRYLEQAAVAYEAERYRDTERAMRVLMDNVPDAPTVIELKGLVEYKTGKWSKAIDNLEFARKASGNDGLIPAIMDCQRARGNYEAVEDLWAELRDASPDAETMADGRVVMASSMAENKDIPGAIELLAKAPKVKGKARDHHSRTWYVLGDLYERAGDVARARKMFTQVADHDPDLADVLDRLDALG